MSIPSRADLLGALAAREFDVLVIGGGITGCAIARDAALRGLSVALVERDDFASGTSSRSSRLVHGGVRYLEYGQLRLVFEASAERRRLLRLAPHLVRPLPFVWPVYKGARIPRWKLSAGLSLYDWLAVFRNVHPHHRLSADAVLEEEPALQRTGLVGGAKYYDASTDDARLTLANAIGALESGAVVTNHVSATAFGLESGTVHEVTAVDAMTKQTLSIRARVVVSATGPWSDDVRRFEGAEIGSTVHGSKGAHIAVPRDRVANRHAVTMLSPRDGRVMFALPDGPLAIIGTTDSYGATSPLDVHATEEDIAYLLESANAFFPAARLTRDDVVAAWAGIRPLVAKTATSSVSASREHEITTSPGGVIAITGGKLTTYRIMAADVVDLAMMRLGRRVERAPTATLALPGGDLVSVDAEERDATQRLDDAALACHLVKMHGRRWRDVAPYVTDADDGRTRIEPGFPYTIGEMRFAVDNELACTLADLLMRRTRLAFETRDHARSAATILAPVVAPRLGWSAARTRAELDAFDGDAQQVFGRDAA